MMKMREMIIMGGKKKRATKNETAHKQRNNYSINTAEIKRHNRLCFDLEEADR